MKYNPRITLGKALKALGLTGVGGGLTISAASLLTTLAGWGIEVKIDWDLLLASIGSAIAAALANWLKHR